jgi:prefoldin subunit 5
VELKSTKDKISQALSQLSSRENELRQGYEKLAKEFEGK